MNTATVLNYHQRTKHRLDGYAKGPETIDWEDQPDPFRRFSGCEVLNLPTPGAALSPTFAALDSPESIAAHPVNLTSLGLLFELAFGLSAWKQFGPSRWSLRCNPSSGNLHPTEAYLIANGHDFIKPGVWHYLSHDHSLEQRCLFNSDDATPDLLIGLSSVHWREAWKYGERAYRYCQHDIGHALGALHYAAATLGWSIELLSECADADLAALFGLDRAGDFIALEQEYPDVVCRIITGQNSAAATIETLLASAKSGDWFGRAESLRAYHFYKWPIIAEVSNAATKPVTAEPVSTKDAPSPILIPSRCTYPATTIIRQRRSAQQFDAKLSGLPRADFYRMLQAVSANQAAFAAWPWSAKVHLFIFVHRVADLSPGLYALPRSVAAVPRLQAATLSDFDWQPVSESLPLYHLYSSNFRPTAKTLSCHQPIASDSAFSLGMLAEFEPSLAETPWVYRRLFWECGLIGQVLYLEAEAAGVRGTGIGCYFDDSMHELLGLKDATFQSLYHFTVGTPLDDNRLETLPAYGHLMR